MSIANQSLLLHNVAKDQKLKLNKVVWKMHELHWHLLEIADLRLCRKHSLLHYWCTCLWALLFTLTWDLTSYWLLYPKGEHDLYGGPDIRGPKQLTASCGSGQKDKRPSNEPKMTHAITKKWRPEKQLTVTKSLELVDHYMQNETKSRTEGIRFQSIYLQAEKKKQSLPLWWKTELKFPSPALVWSIEWNSSRVNGHWLISYYQFPSLQGTDNSTSLRSQHWWLIMHSSQTSSLFLVTMQKLWRSLEER